jgi:hypothetical protein
MAPTFHSFARTRGAARSSSKRALGSKSIRCLFVRTAGSRRHLMTISDSGCSPITSKTRATCSPVCVLIRCDRSQAAGCGWTLADSPKRDNSVSVDPICWGDWVNVGPSLGAAKPIRDSFQMECCCGNFRLRCRMLPHIQRDHRQSNYGRKGNRSSYGDPRPTGRRNVGKSRRKAVLRNLGICRAGRRSWDGLRLSFRWNGSRDRDRDRGLLASPGQRFGSADS